MARFMKCTSVPGLYVTDDQYQRSFQIREYETINIDNICTIEKCDLRDGGRFYSLKFEMANGNTVRWSYTSKADMDSQYEAILNTQNT